MNQVELRLLKILDPIVPLDPQLPELKEGSLVPDLDIRDGTVTQRSRRLVDITDTDKSSMAVHYSMPDIPVDSEYVE